MIPSSRAGAMVHVWEMGPYPIPPFATVNFMVSWSVLPPAVLVAMSHMSWGMGIRMKGPFVMERMAGRPNIPDASERSRRRHEVDFDGVRVARHRRAAGRRPGPHHERRQ